MMKKCVVFNLTYFVSVKHGCVISTKEIFSFLPPTNNSAIYCSYPQSENHHIIKHYQNFPFLSLIVMFNTLADVHMT